MRKRCLTLVFALFFPLAALAVSELEKGYIYLQAGEKLLNQKKYGEALKYFYASSKIMPKDLRPWKNMGFCYYGMKNHKNAYAMFRKVLEMSPEDKDARDFMSFYGNIMDQQAKKREKREMTDPLWRSALLPGWGQVHNGQLLKGLIIGGGFIACASMTAYSIADEADKYDKYIKTNENHDIAYKKFEDAHNAAIIWSVMAGSVYIYNLIDAALNYDSEEAKLVLIPVGEKEAALCLTAKW